MITNRGAEGKLVNITYVLARADGGAIVQSSSGSALVLAYQTYTYPVKITTFETGRLQLSVEVTGIVEPVTVICEPQASNEISLSFLVVPLGIASLPLTLLGFGLALYGIRREEETLAICGGIFAILGVLVLILFGQVWLGWLTSLLPQ
jgi:hypothetical protein